MTAVGWGKVILLGEHAVVYGYPALAAALDRGVRIDAVGTPAGGPLRLDIPAWDLRVSASARDEDHPVARALAAIADELAIGRPAVTLLGDAQILHSAGLGSSAAMAVAIARALLTWSKRRQDVPAILAAASASEAVMHGKASGIDATLATHGGIGVYRKTAGLRPISAKLRVLVAPSGAPRSTAAMVDRVAQATLSGATKAAHAGAPITNDDPRLVELGNLTDTGTTSLLRGDLAGLGAAMNRSHEVLAELGVSTAQLDSLCEAARATGAHGAKLTGAGGGGAVIAIAPRDRESAILAEWKNAGVTGFVSTVGT
jgi:mevalonate kinase